MTLPAPTRSVRVRQTFTGYHEWPEAQGERAYLASRHRHEFTVTAELGVTHADREVEFHDVADFLARCLHGNFASDPTLHATTYELGRRSCEDVGAVIAADLEARWPGRVLYVEVSEDEQVHACLFFRSAPDLGGA